MASAVLANRNEPDWTQPRANFMGKAPFSNPNPNPKFSKKRQFQQHLHDVEEPPAITQSAASDDASSINHHRRASDFNTGGYVTFNVANYSKKELVELKNRLAVELEQIRVLKNRINASESQIRSGSNFTNARKLTPNIGKNVSGNKRPFQATNFGTGVKGTNPENGQLMKKCGPILTKLMKHKLGYIFNTPVDVVGLQLHDYYDIIKNPMDLGTVKSKLGKNLYDSPYDFAADVRLTFNNAMRYNPKGHEVYVLAEQFLSRFEELFRPVRDKVGDFDEGFEEEHVQEVQASSWDHIPKKDNHENSIQAVAAKSEQITAIGSNQIPKQQSSSQLPVRTPSPPIRAPPVKPVKQPKPKAKDPNKREMSLEEKHKLGLGLQSLPQEKMEQVVQIIRKRNGHLRQEGDEIELDIEAVDTETLWELDRFVTNYKKMVSKIKRQALMAVNNNAAATSASEGNKDVAGNDRTDAATEAKKPKKGEAGDEDVDIGDDMPMSSFPPVEIEKDNGHASSSSSSSSSSSDDSSSSSGVNQSFSNGVENNEIMNYSRKC
ncbi:hypothetical protein K2173_024006 [Erythroxylum novogranatense]|uniref:Uncharacterized protein n=1 Tax=Erythroxylum novogranatense TaxID=1862640 RepID=A0AAV8TQ27_9ROSI|nr:hypothetical protein K2173_024006 [Erythroxylum novogranatense]